MNKAVLYRSTAMFFVMYCSTSTVLAAGIQHQNRGAGLTFSVISDIHLRAGKSDWGYPYQDQQAQMKFTSALLDLNKINPNQNALIINGDVTTTGMQSDYDYMNKVLQSNRHPSNTLFTIGNHEFYSAVRDKHGRRNTEAFPNGATEAQCIHRFLKNTGTPNVYYDTWIQGYHFIMLGSEQSIITNGRRGDGAFLSQTQLEWLRKRLMESAGGRPIFVFLHEPIPYTVEGSTWRDIVNPGKLKIILSKYPQVIFFSGHSHRTLKWQTHAMYRNGFTMFNDSSVRNPVDAHNRLMGDSEGLYVQVYDDKVVVKGRDFTHKVWINQYTVPIPHFGASGVTRYHSHASASNHGQRQGDGRYHR